MRLVKRCLCIFLFLFFFVGSVYDVGAAEPLTVRVGTYDNKPKIYQDVDGKTSGVYADILNYIAQKENWNIEYVYGLWEEGLARLENGQIDIMADVAISSERQKKYDFSTETIMDSRAVIYVQEDSAIDSILDLEGKKIAILKYSVYGGGRWGIEDYLRSFGISATIMEVDENSLVLYLVETGTVDAGIVSYIFGQAHKDDYFDLKATNIFLKPTELRFALVKGASNNKYLIGRLDYWVKKIKGGHENFYDQTLRKYGLLGFEDQVETQARQKNGMIPLWLMSASLGAALAFLVSGFWVMLLFRRLKRNDRTIKSRKK